MCRIGKTSFCENWLSAPVCKQLTARAPPGGPSTGAAAASKQRSQLQVAENGDLYGQCPLAAPLPTLNSKTKMGAGGGTPL